MGQQNLNPIAAARQFVMSQVQLPALASSTLPAEAKAKVRSSNTWLARFRRVGDLLRYLERFDSSNADPLYLQLKQHGLMTFEDIAGEFKLKFDAWADDRTRASDFVIGEKYTPHELLIFANVYDTRAGGMFVLTAGGEPNAILIKATLSDGRYKNEWLVPSTRLKYYLKAINGNFGEHFAPNAAILTRPGIPILTFARNSEREPFTYYGVFAYTNIVREKSGKWFDLKAVEEAPDEVLVSQAHLEREFREQVAVSLAGTVEERQERLASAAKLPKQIQVRTTLYVRNPDVVVEVLRVANGVCGDCGGPAPFNKRDGTPFLEVHHKIRLADGGEDTVANAVALCPNCHRRQHYG